MAELRTWPASNLTVRLVDRPRPRACLRKRTAPSASLAPVPFAPARSSSKTVTSSGARQSLSKSPVTTKLSSHCGLSV